jgi:hypothetical protein
MKKLLAYLIILITFISFNSIAFAGCDSDLCGVLHVRVLDQSDNTPIPGATVRCWGVGHDEGITDGNGQVNLTFKPCMGNEASCRVRAGGYEERTLDVRAVRGGEAGATIKLKYQEY